MADENDILIKIAADIEELKKGLGDAGKIVTDAASKMEGAGDAVKGMAGEMGEAVKQGSELGSIIGEVVGEGLKKFMEWAYEATVEVIHMTEEMSKLNLELERTSAQFGMSVPEVVKWQNVAEETGTSFGTMQAGLQGLSRTIGMAEGGNKQAIRDFQALGIELKDVHGQTKSLDAVMFEIADKFHGWADGANKAADAQRIFRGAGREMIPMLNEGGEAIRGIMSEADAYAASLERLQGPMNEFRANTLAIELSNKLWWAQLEERLMPSINALVKLYMDLVNVSDEVTESSRQEPIYFEAIQTVVTGLTAMIANLVFWFQEQMETGVYSFEVIKNALYAMKAAFVAFYHGDLDGIEKAWKDMTEKNAEAFDIMTKKVSDDAEALKQILDKLYHPDQGPQQPSNPFAGGGPGVPQAPTIGAIGGPNPLDAWAKQIVGAMNEINGQFNSMIQGLLTGTETFKDAFRKMMQSLVMDFITACERMLERWILTQIAQTMSQAEQAALQKAITAESNHADLAGLLERGISHIAADTAQTGAGATAFFAPELGPAAPAAGAAVAASAEAMYMAQLTASLDVGAWRLDSDMFARLHKGEMVVPASFAEGMRGDGGAMGGDNHFHFHGTVIGTRKFFEDNGEFIANAMLKQSKRLHPATRPQVGR